MARRASERTTQAYWKVRRGDRGKHNTGSADGCGPAV